MRNLICFSNGWKSNRIPHKFSFVMLRKPNRKFCGMTPFLWIFDFSIQLIPKREKKKSSAGPKMRANSPVATNSKIIRMPTRSSFM